MSIDFSEFLPKNFARQRPSGVRIMAPTGRIGYVPESSVNAALVAGAKIVTVEDMRALRQEVFMQHGIFKEQHAEPEKGRKRRSIVWKGRQ